MDYTLIRSARKTIALQMKPEGLIVRAPYAATQAQIEALLAQHADWIGKQRARLAAQEQRFGPAEPLTAEALRALTAEARRVIPARAARYAPLVGVNYGRITIRHQRSRWGSCSAAGNLSFNCLLMLAPPEVLDSVVVHELCHRLVPNHSKRFYAEVLRVFPDYWRCRDWLRENGPALLRRIND
ncbi:MAG: M48 family metallopeptidase [Oscillospiraceae bacterium]|nr:M48 family metallopeptidase [Oscillospiraceae bacterium]MBR7056189.1 M48 family metallopeptidase [Oscillospiraceae bacterium]